LNEVRVEGESRIPEMAGRVRRIWLEPNDAPAFPPTLKEVLNADLIVVGPGSLYTSLLPNLLVKDLLGLEEGDVLSFDYALDRPMTTALNGIAKFKGRVVSKGNKKAFLIDNRYTP
jgi:hypothetical protein